MVLLGIKWYWVSIIGLLCLYILKNMEICSDVTIAGRQANKRQTNKERKSYSAIRPWKAEMSNSFVEESFNTLVGEPEIT